MMTGLNALCLVVAIMVGISYIAAAFGYYLKWKDERPKNKAET